jgi:uroporphyrin-III C-methyltransferase/precorrin-2 dehydrogenase/sirohydrochlorin ferrochelatase
VSIIPLGFHGDSVVALVVGGGRVATRRAIALLDAGARVRVIAPDVSPELEARSQGDENLILERRLYAGTADLTGATMVVGATGSNDVNERVAQDAIDANLPVNVADAPHRSSFDFLATHRSGPVVIGVSAGGVPGAAQRIRDSIADRIDARYGDAVAACARLRARTLSASGTQRWNEICDELIGADFCDVVESGDFAGRIARWG